MHHPPPGRVNSSVISALNAMCNSKASIATCKINTKTVSNVMKRDAHTDGFGVVKRTTEKYTSAGSTDGEMTKSTRN